MVTISHAPIGPVFVGIRRNVHHVDERSISRLLTDHYVTVCRCCPSLHPCSHFAVRSELASAHALNARAGRPVPRGPYQLVV